ncbi:transcription/translation regulatory transformer protein RfaH [Halopseudomonas salegens]|uniref:Transcription antitermination protein RfaH n=1 Tax=Halopseudomonas salegens TaxID=1434072 RepID=A0A1H2FKI9_9GAMM|nr:transcription/translation regulatory transformer protein RfaH [Halopseudomonas salegens]SDU07873.1 transcriptional antiterminator RfaH [Halopseudomonas salegens]
MQSSKADGWYLVQCKSRQDERAEWHLRNQQINCYRPVHCVERVRGGKRVLLSESLFPGYLFVRMAAGAEQWSSIRSTRGVARMVTFGGLPLKLEPALIHAIKQRADQQPAESAFRVGDLVRITEGPLRELDAVFLHPDGNERAVLLINLLHREQRLKMPLRAIRVQRQRA